MYLADCHSHSCVPVVTCIVLISCVLCAVFTCTTYLNWISSLGRSESNTSCCCCGAAGPLVGKTPNPPLELDCVAPTSKCCVPAAFFPASTYHNTAIEQLLPAGGWSRTGRTTLITLPLTTQRIDSSQPHTRSLTPPPTIPQLFSAQFSFHRPHISPSICTPQSLLCLGPHLARLEQVTFSPCRVLVCPPFQSAMSYPSTVRYTTSYRQPLPTVNCPYCTLLLEYPPDAHIIRCPVCEGTSMLQVMQQLHMPCRRCHMLLSYFPHYALLQCPQCHLQQAPPPPALAYTAHAVRQPNTSTTSQLQQHGRRETTQQNNVYPGTYAQLPAPSPSQQKLNVQPAAANNPASQPQAYRPPAQRTEPLSAGQPTTPAASAPRLSVPDNKPRSKSMSSSQDPPLSSTSASTAPSTSSASSTRVSVSATSASSAKPLVTALSSSSSSSKRTKSPKLTELLAGVHISSQPPPAPTRQSLSALDRSSRQSGSIDINQITPVVGDYSSFSSSADDEKRNPPTGVVTTPSSSAAASALSRLNPVGGHSVNDGQGRFVALAEESTVEYSRWDGEPSVYRREQEEDSEEVGAVEADDGDNPGAGPGAVFRGRQAVYSPTSLSRQQSASVYHND